MHFIDMSSPLSPERSSWSDHKYFVAAKLALPEKRVEITLLHTTIKKNKAKCGSNIILQ